MQICSENMQTIYYYQQPNIIVRKKSITYFQAATNGSYFHKIDNRIFNSLSFVRSNKYRDSTMSKYLCNCICNLQQI